MPEPDDGPVEVTPDQRRRIAVLGEIPFCGSAAVRVLLERRMTARVLCPDAEALQKIRALQPADSPEDVEIVSGDAGNPKAVNEVVGGCYGACFLSPITMNGRLYRPKTHLNDVRELIKAAELHAIRKLTYHSAFAAHPESSTKALRDAAEAEELIQAARCEDFRLRTGPIMGVGDGFMTELIKIAKAGSLLMNIWGYGDTLVQPLHVNDFARCLARVFEDKPEELKPGFYLLGGPERLTLLELIDDAVARLGRAKLKIHSPFFLLKLLAGVRNDATFSERINLLMEPHATEKNQVPELLGTTRLLSPSDVQKELLGVR